MIAAFISCRFQELSRNPRMRRVEDVACGLQVIKIELISRIDKTLVTDKAHPDCITPFITDLTFTSEATLSSVITFLHFCEFDFSCVFLYRTETLIMIYYASGLP